ncbi:MAG: hypothetical protein A2Y33_14565 [Spirochaetes bacterium GWF1_51_8]|nr:MAG: hypothetical protein A2Y33_14565 [Spirochaetes bacterium GWF1_51_8]
MIDEKKGHNIIPLVVYTNIGDMSKSSDPRKEFVEKIFSPIFDIFIKNNISPGWVSFILITIFFIISEIISRKQRNERSQHFGLGVFIMLFLLVISLITQVTMCTKVK